MDEDLLKVLAAIRTITDEPCLSAADKVDHIQPLLHLSNIRSVLK